jgi:NADH-quinone oxidoreductase subunit J
MNFELILFYVFAALTVASAANVVAARVAINSAMSLVATFFFLAGIYVLLWAHTIAVIQVLVYAGAIMVLFLFVIMLLAIGDEGGPAFKLTGSRIVGGLTAAGLLAVLVIAQLRYPRSGTLNFDQSSMMSFGTLQTLGHVLYTQYLFPFEAVSLLLLVAIVGAVVVSKSRI